ncbi:hypothetical protein FZEAL_5165 [Fusarium zealandicum]|uniref:(S)-ureidoglycine aminohydrolase cupin domain-containing protein n=1 Tax=Fusarium zealandicum TaxID=1053134 RepID=A0A8H4XKU9_9HYPO|nr:hypothetical protein FZEAL_5165 [Fusarium zealandicum]
MHFSLATSLTFLAAISHAAAWHVTAYNNVQDCNPNDETEYQILEGNQGNCYSFGWSMPGVSCGHYIRGGAENKGCAGKFNAVAMYFHAGSNCQVYAEDDCRGVSTVRSENECVNDHEVLGGAQNEPSPILSFKCENTDAVLVAWDAIGGETSRQNRGTCQSQQLRPQLEVTIEAFFDFESGVLGNATEVPVEACLHRKKQAIEPQLKPRRQRRCVLSAKIVPLTIIKGAGHEHIPIPEGENAIVADFHSIRTQTVASPAHLTSGFYRVVPGPTRYGSYDYEETKYVLRGQIDVTDEATGITHHLVAGDWAFFHVGSKAQFSTKSEGVAFYAVTRPVNDIHVNLQGREEDTSKL